MTVDVFVEVESIFKEADGREVGYGDYKVKRKYVSFPVAYL